MADAGGRFSALHASDTQRLDFHFDQGNAALDLIATHGKFFFGLSLSYDGLSSASGRHTKDVSSGQGSGGALSLGDEVHTLGSALLRFGVRLTPRTALFSTIGGALQDATHLASYSWSGLQSGIGEVRTDYVIDPVTCERRAVTTSETVSALVSTTASYVERRFDTGLYVGAGLWTALSPFAILKFDYTFLDFGEVKAELKLNRKSSDPRVLNIGPSTKTISWRDVRHSFKMRLKVVF